MKREGQSKARPLTQGQEMGQMKEARPWKVTFKRDGA